MKGLFTIILALISITLSAQHVPRIKELKTAFKPSSKEPWEESQWIFCNNDSAYYKSDTIRGYKPAEDIIPWECCDVVQWAFYSRSTFSLYEISRCQEPPTGVHYLHDYYRVIYDQQKEKLYLDILKAGKFHSRYQVLSLDTVILPERSVECRVLTLAKVKH